MLEVEVRLSAMPLGRGIGFCTRRYILKLCVIAFCYIFYNIYGKMWGIPENVSRFLKYVFHIPEGRHLGLAQQKTRIRH